MFSAQRHIYRIERHTLGVLRFDSISFECACRHGLELAVT